MIWRYGYVVCAVNRAHADKTFGKYDDQLTNHFPFPFPRQFHIVYLPHLVHFDSIVVVNIGKARTRILLTLVKMTLCRK